MGLREVKGEGAALIGPAAHADISAQQAGGLAADGQAQAGAAVFAAGAAVRLTEGFKDDGDLFRGDADAGVGDGKGHHIGGVVQARMPLSPAGGDLADAQRHPACGGEFEGIGEQVFHHLFQPLVIGLQRGGSVFINDDVEGEGAALGHGLEGAAQALHQRLDGDGAGIDGHGTGFDLGEVEDVADQTQQVGAGGLDGFEEFDLAGGEISLAVGAELLGQQQE